MWIFLLTLALAKAQEFQTFQTTTSLRRNYNPIQLVNWKWNCDADYKCRRIKGDKENKNKQYFHYIEGCKSVCGLYGSLWPRPTGETKINHELEAFNLEDIAVKFDSPKDANEQFDEILTEAWSIFSQYLAVKGHSKIRNGGKNIKSKRSHVLVKITVQTQDLTLDLKTDESYSCSINTRKGSAPRDEVIVHVIANTFYGARHALESLSQLITFDPIESCHRIPSSVKLKDTPTYPYRGVLLDTGRNFYSVPSIKRIIDGLSYNKLNVLHWHMNEQQSFPFVSERVPNLTRFGAYNADSVYYKDEIKGLVMYARQRGVLLLPEFDAPAHASYGWQFGPEANLGNLTTCFGQHWEDDSGGHLAPEPPAGQLNPLNENVYKILGELFKDMIEAFTPMHSKEPLKIFHLGGDEVNFKCWEREAQIKQWMAGQGFETDSGLSNQGYLYLWSLFQEKALKELVKSNQGKKFEDGTILWTSELTKPEHISKFIDASKYIIQVWTTGTDPTIGELLKQKYRLIMSNYDSWYLDCGFGAWLYSDVGPDTNWCAPFKGWKTMYKNNMRNIVAYQGLNWNTYGKLVLGGEITMWSEQSDEYTVETKLWPRGCAFAERLWSDPQDTSWKEAEPRLLEMRHLMVHERGLHADAPMPEFCRQNDGECYTTKKFIVDSQFDNSFINAPFTLAPTAKQHHSEIRIAHHFYDLMGLKTLLVIAVCLLLFVRRRFIFNALRTVKFMPIS